MKLARLVLAALAVTMTLSWAAASSACDKEKASATTAAKATKASATVMAVTADHASGKAHACTPEQMAACRAQGASASTHRSCAGKVSAVTASAGGSSCGTKGGAKASKYDAAAAGGSSCGTKSGTKASKYDAAAAGGSSCSGHGFTQAGGKSAHADCEACVDMNVCGQELSAAHAQTQVVPLKNGVMFVYTADSPSQVTAVQSAMTRRGERMMQLVKTSTKAKLCEECKTMRSAMANGKLTREVVNIEGGALTLMTSTDPTLLAKIHAMVEVKPTARAASVKS